MSVQDAGCDLVMTVLASISVVSIASYLVMVILQSFVFTEQDFKKKYSATWGLVTGSSSGIGRSIAERLASQGINVVLVALDDETFTRTMNEIRTEFPKVEFREVRADLSGCTGDYMQAIKSKTSDIDVNLVFNNAGYIIPGLFADLSIEGQLKNYEVNSTCALQITHHFVNDMLNKRLSGLIAFTSSSAAYIPGPMAAIYGCTKAMITHFASSLAAEVQSNGIDVLVVHPSPINSGFYNNAGTMESLRFFQKTARSPSVITDCIFTSAGRTVVRDQGYFSIGSKLMLKVLDWNALTEIIRYGISTSGDFVTMAGAKKRPYTSLASGKN
eukprot:CFRG5965T1